jgi:isoleucyl-tRNA synthetase
MRWYFFSSPVWNPTRFSLEIIEDARRRFFNTLWNVYSFFVTNINIDNIDPREITNNLTDRSVLDQWLISKLNSLIVMVRDALDKYESHKAAAAIDRFVVEDLSNWYIRRSRRRFWNSEVTKDKKDALSTLYETLVTLTKLLAPFVPFASEEIYQNLVRKLNKKNKDAPISVHFEDFPKKKSKAINPQLEEAMDFSIAIVEAGRAARAQANIKVRLPIQELIIVCPVAQQKMAKQYLPEIKEELNVKEILFQAEFSEMVDYHFKPKFQLLGPAFKQNAPIVGATIKALDGEKAQKVVLELKDKGKFTLETEEGIFNVSEDQVEVISSGKEGYADASFPGGQVFIKTELTPELIQEGLVRDIIRRVQSMRKDANLEYTQNIELYYKGDEETKTAIAKWEDYIKTETLTTVLKAGTKKTGITSEWEIDDKKVVLTIIPIEK